MDGFGSGGGSLALAELIDEHGGVLVADFADHYGLRLADVLLEWSPSELLALVEGLPDGCRFHAHVAGGDKWREFVGWGKDRHMFADWVDVFVKFNTDPKKRAWSYPRPAVKAAASSGVPLMSMFPSRGGRSSL